MGKVLVMEHPLIQHKVGIIRRKEVGSKDFREIISEIAMYMCYEATRDLKLQDVEIETPICKGTGRKETGCCANLKSWSWNGRRYAYDDSGGKGRSYWTLS